MLPLLLNATPTSFLLVLHNRNILSILPEFPHKLFYMIKEKVSSSQSVKLITWTVIPVIIIFGLLIPGINLFTLIGLPILGVLESFFDLKKLGADYEDHS